MREPPGSRKSSAMRAPRPATPGSSKSPSTAASPSATGHAGHDDLLGVGVVDAHRRLAVRRRARGARRWRRGRPPRSSCRSCRCSPPRSGLPRPARRCSPPRRRDGVGAPMMKAFESEEMPPPEPVELAPVGVGAAERGEQDAVALGRPPGAGRARGRPGSGWCRRACRPPGLAAGSMRRPSRRSPRLRRGARWRGGGGLGEQAAGQQHVALARAQDRAHAEARAGARGSPPRPARPRRGSRADRRSSSTSSRSMPS